jgi:hypothetical protein
MTPAEVQPWCSTPSRRARAFKVTTPAPASTATCSKRASSRSSQGHAPGATERSLGGGPAPHDGSHAAIPLSQKWCFERLSPSSKSERPKSRASFSRWTSRADGSCRSQPKWFQARRRARSDPRRYFAQRSRPRRRAHLIRQIRILRVEQGDAQLQVVEELSFYTHFVIDRRDVVGRHETVRAPEQAERTRRVLTGPVITCHQSPKSAVMPMGLPFAAGSIVSFRMASNTTLN